MIDMKKVQVTDANVIESIRGGMPVATSEQKGLLSDLYRDRIQPYSVVSSGRCIYGIDYNPAPQQKVSLVSIGQISFPPSVYLISMGSHQNSSHGVIVPKIVRLSGTDNYEFFYKMDDENNVELYVLVKEKYVRVCVINLLQSSPSKHYQMHEYTDDISALTSMGSI